MKTTGRMFFVLVFVFALAACAHKPPKVPPERPPGGQLGSVALDSQIDSIFQSVMRGIESTPYRFGKMILTSGSLRQGLRFSKLEDYIMNALTRRLRQQAALTDKKWSLPYETPLRIMDLCREDWIPLKEGDAPLSLSEAERFAILETSLKPVKELNKVIASVSAYTFSNGKKEDLPGIGGAMHLDFSSGSPAGKLYNATVPLPLPRGCEETPYGSLEDLAYGLVSEVLEAYPSAELGVVDIKADPELSRKLVSFLRKAIEDYLVKNGAKIGLGKSDYSNVASQLRFYHKHMIFKGPDVNEYPYPAGTIYFLIDVRPGLSEQTTIRASLRALWLTTGEAGTYLEGLMGIAYAVPPWLASPGVMWSEDFAGVVKNMTKGEAIRLARWRACDKLKKK